MSNQTKPHNEIKSMSIKNNILRLLPVFAQNIVISLYGYKLIKQRYGQEYYRYRNELMQMKGCSIEKLQEQQNVMLNNFIHYAIKKSKFYRYLYKNINLDEPFSISSLKALPIVTKEMLRENLDDVYTLPTDQGVSSFTGGTTGKSLQVVFTDDDFQHRMAYLDAFKLKLGIDPFLVRKATFSGREFTRGWATSLTKTFWRNNWAYKQRLYSTFDMTQDNLSYYVKNLNSYQPQQINGFVSAIYQLAKYISQHEITLTFQPQAIFTTSETLLPFHRQLIEKTFSCPVYNQYASAEGAPFITQCNAGNLHYNLDTGVIEVLNTAAGQEMLVTSFTTHGTPLIRYQIGDLIQFKKGVCSCGSSHPLVESIDGRQVESLTSSEYGNVSLSHLADVIKGLPNCIRSVQFQQYTIDEIQVLLNVDKNLFDQHAEDKIAKALTHRFGKKTQFTFKLVNDIPKEKSGKFSLIKNYLAPSVGKS
jgi:phenylacetate-CoA ligase